MLNLLYLVDKGLLDIPVLYLSRHIIQNKPIYYRYLLEVTTQAAWEQWVLFMLEAIRSTALWTTARILHDLLQQTAARIRQDLPTASFVTPVIIKALRPSRAERTGARSE